MPWGEAVLLARLLWALPHFLRTPITLAEARATVEAGMRTRETAFLGMLQEAIYGHPASPYRVLLDAAGIELPDVRRLVLREGVEETLRILLAAGVYVTFEEFKRRTPIRRGSQVYTLKPRAFDNPLVRPHLVSRSGGTTGSPTLVQVHLDDVAQSTPQWVLWFAAHSLLDRPLVFWTPAYFSVNNMQLKCAKFGKRYEKWFRPVERNGAVRLPDALVRWVSGFRRPEYAPLTHAARVAAYLAGRRAEAPAIVTSPSAAVRVSMAARERGWSLEGVTFLLGYEPLTEARKETITASGARAVPTYGSTEAPGIGSQCAFPTATDDIHICLDAYAVIQRSRPAGFGDVDAILLTALRPAAPKILLNTEIGDSAVLETRECECLFHQLGFVRHLHTIRSFEKLTGEGVTFWGADLYPLIERTLPQRFGGSAVDYQLVEREDGRGLPRYELRISPEVGVVDEPAVVRLLLGELGSLRRGYRVMATLWETISAIEVNRQPPLPTPGGKILPYRTLRTP